MRRPALFAVLLATACSGGSKRTGTTGGGGDDVAAAPDAAPVAAPDPALAARKAYSNPGGMWLPRQMDLPQHAAAFAEMGVALDPAVLTDPLAAPLGAVVSLDHCTGSFVSSDGLVITNHHCVISALQQNSTPEKNILEDGFLAKTMADEITAGASQRVMVQEGYRDVTADVITGLDQIVDPEARRLELEKREKQLVADCEKGRAGIECNVVKYFRGAEYQLIESREITDVRLVYAPHRGIGYYGGEVDNWQWPRHTGDFALLRAYVDGAPYKPAHWLKIASHPLEPNDFAMVVGYPGSTSRISTYSEVMHDVEFTYPYLIEYLQAYYEVLEEAQATGKGFTPIKAAAYLEYIQNALSNTRGKLEGLTGGDLLTRKQELDQRVRAWAAEPGREDVAAALEKMESLLAEDHTHARADFDFGTAVAGSSLFQQAMLLVVMAEERPKKDADRKPGYQDRDMPQHENGQAAFLYQYDQAIDKAGFLMSLRRALALPEADRPWLPLLIGAKKGAKVDDAMLVAAVDKLYAKTTLTDLETRQKLLRKGTTKQLKKSKDPFIRIALAVRPLTKDLETRNDRLAGELMLLSPQYATAMREVLDGLLSPDANGTLRITYGTVKPFAPGDDAFTHASDILTKNTGEAPFAAPQAELDAITGDARDLPVNFLTDLDITGGNSGSPTLDAYGELIGLAFDGTISGLASDVVFDGAVTRTIHCDIRYAVWVMGLDHADNLLAELGVAR